MQQQQEEHKRAYESGGKHWQSRLSMAAAALIVALLAGSLLFVLNNSRRNGSSGPTTISSRGPAPLLSLRMVDASTGWALTTRAVLSTVDGGATWKNKTPPRIVLTRSSIADFPTASVASIATPRLDGASIQVLHTIDGGQTWQQATISMPYPRQISFTDPQHGWLLAAVRPPAGAAEPVSVYRTTDGGKTWVIVASALFADTTVPGRLPYGGQKSSIRFLNSSTGWVTGTVPLADLAWLYITHDAGLTWQHQSLLVPRDLPPGRLSLLAPTFFSTTDGVLPVIFSNVATGTDFATTIYTTRDGGESWQSTMPVSAPLRIVSFADRQHGWATDGTALYNTGDGGNHWLKLSPGRNFKNIVQLDFASDTIGWAISSTLSNGSTLLKTVDGGHTWTPLPYIIS